MTRYSLPQPIPTPQKNQVSSCELPALKDIQKHNPRGNHPMMFGNYCMLMKFSAFSELHGITEEEVMMLVDDGEYYGYCRNGEWFIEMDISDMTLTGNEFADEIEIAGAIYDAEQEELEKEVEESLKRSKQYLKDNPVNLHDQLTAYDISPKRFISDLNGDLQLKPPNKPNNIMFVSAILLGIVGAIIYSM